MTGLILPELSRLLSYQNERVVEQFSRANEFISLDESKQLFSDLLGWMWLSVARKQNGLLTHMFGPLLLLDEFWHVFILNTKCYVDFCNHYFGTYFHHEVESIDEPFLLTEDYLSNFLSDSYEWLGRDWVERHFMKLLRTLPT